MKHFPIFLSLEGQAVALAGGGEAALAKLRLLLKTEAAITVFSARPAREIRDWAAVGRLTLVPRAFVRGDAPDARLFYAATEDAEEDQRVAGIAAAQGALVNIVDNLQDSAFITPAIVDRDPVTIAIGTEGAAPVLARAIKADLEAQLPADLGVLARIGKAFRRAAEALSPGRARRDFWAEYYFRTGPRALSQGGTDQVETALDDLLNTHLGLNDLPGHVAFVGAGPGDPELLTLKARKALDRADVVIYDRLVAPGILELARREARMIYVGKEGFGPAMAQSDINRIIVDEAAKGGEVVRLKSGDPTLFGRLDEEIAACDAAGLDWSIVPGITAASAAVAGIGQSLTRRGRNSSLRILTGHDMKGLAEQDWAALARPDAVAAIYMGKRAARFVQGRLLMHGARPETDISIVENASRPDQRVIATTLSALAGDIADAGLSGPALIFLGLAPRRAAATISETIAQEFA